MNNLMHDHHLSKTKNNYLNSKLISKKLAFHKAKILLIDDCLIIQTFLTNQLRELGYEVEVANNGIEALDKLNAHYDAIITDIEMPKMDGLTLIKNIRNSRKFNKNIPILVLSTLSNEKKVECIMSGADEVSSKPITSDKLAWLIKKLLKANHNPS